MKFGDAAWRTFLLLAVISLMVESEANRGWYGAVTFSGAFAIAFVRETIFKDER